MAELFDLEYSTAFYRSKDHLKNLKIKVTLRRGSTLNIISQHELEAEPDAIDHETNTVKPNYLKKQDQDQEDYEFIWQEKLFSRREYEKYLKLENCVTPIEKLYHESCVKMAKEGGRPNLRLFSFVDHDNYSPLTQDGSGIVLPPYKEEPYLAERMKNLRYRQNALIYNKAQHSRVARSNLVDYNPSEEQRKQTHYTSGPMKVMHIMADLNKQVTSEDPALEANEVLLCTIRAYANDIISICPDFSNRSRAYRVNTDSALNQELFEFFLDHTSKQLTWQEKEKEAKLMRGLMMRHEDFMVAQVGQDFEMNPADTLHVLVLGEIVSAQDFDCDDIFIQYLLDLPNGWTLMNKKQQLGTTHSSRSKSEGPREIYNFSFPLEFQLIYQKDPYLPADPNRTLPEWPTLYLEVQSVDSMTRCRVEGYSYTSLPLVPGVSMSTVQCWRPRGNSLVSELRRFFIGGTPELEDVTYTARPSTFSGSRMSRFGFKTVSTGSITLRFSCIQQSQLFMYSAASKKKVGSVLHKTEFTQKQMNIMNVIEAFRRAKNRMVAAREHLKKDFADTITATHLD